ncbi:YfhO family protein [Lactobacillus sp. S2-2]|uniref:YfhO family protein n=1 Tax=Lactobacillus sp. S2-2 TaxID=2692917 RepID=UPI001F3142CE|nr:YfhO family protein [Lactobacillus sp. S2-2]MCF6514638.1 YfhO family protein [Lactobacillus sp. S2-2]
MKKMKSTINYLLAFLIPVLVASVVFALNGITPFGDHNLLISDLGTQYFPFFNMLRNHLVNHNFSSYSFLLSIGNNTIPVYTYYLMSPLNLIVGLFDISKLPILINVIILIKIGLIGLSMSLFLRIKYKRFDIGQLIASVSFALCGFVAMYFYDFMWLEALIMLPLVTLGIERLFYRSKWGVYVLTLTLMIIFNYYMGYMTCIYSVIYFSYLVIKNKADGEGFFKYLKYHSKMTTKYILNSIISGLLSAALLIPTMISMLGTDKGSFSLSSFIPYPRFSPAVFTNIGVGANDFMGRLKHDPSIFTGTLIAMGVILYFISHKITKKSKKASGFLIGSLALSMWITLFYTVFHMFQLPAGFPYRNVFMISFVAIMLAYEAYVEGSFSDFKLVKKSGIYVALALVLGYLFAYQQQLIVNNLTSTKHWFINKSTLGHIQYITSLRHLFYALIFVVLIVLIFKYIRNSKYLKIVLLFVVAFELGTNFYLSLNNIPFGSQAKFEQTYNKSKKIIDSTKNKSSNEFGRYDIDNQLYSNIFNDPYNQYNDSLIYNINGVSGYSSTLDSKTHDVLNDLGLFSRNARRISVVGSTKITDQLLGVSKQLTISNDGYQYKENKKYAGLGYMNPDKINKFEFSDDVFSNLDRLVQSQADNHKKYLIRPSIERIGKFKDQTYFDSLGNRVKKHHYQVDLTALTTGPQYMYLPKENLISDKIKVNGKKIPERYNMLGTEIISLGNFKKNQSISIDLLASSKLEKFNKYFAGLDETKFNRFINSNQAYKFKLDSGQKAGSKFSGSIKATHQRNMLVLGITNDPGWNVKADDKKIETKDVIGGLMGIKLSPGKHHLQFDYQVPGLKLGILISIFGFILIFAQLIIKKIRK